MIKTNEVLFYNSKSAATFRDAKYELALLHLRKMIKLQSSFFQSDYSSLKLLHLQGKYKQMEVKFQHLVLTAPPYLRASILTEWGEFLLEQNKFEEAKGKLAQALKLDSTLLTLYKKLEITEKTREAFESSFIYFTLVTDVDKFPVEAINNEGEKYFYQGRYKDAIAKFEQVLEKSKDFSRGYMNLSLSLYCDGQYEEAKKMFEEGCQVIKNNDNKGIIEIIQFYDLSFQGTQTHLLDIVEEERRMHWEMKCNGLKHLLEMLRNKYLSV